MRTAAQLGSRKALSPAGVARPATYNPLRSVAAARVPHGRMVSRTAINAVRTQDQHLPTLSSLSAVIDIESKVTQFEVFAGRSAMIGFAVAALVELVTQDGIFHPLTLEVINSVALLGVTLVAVASTLAVTSKARYGMSLREAVITSLTASARSAGSITQAPVDKAVDKLFDTVISDNMSYLTIPDDDHI